MRTDFGGPYDSMDTRTHSLFEMIGQERRRDVSDQDDVALARRAEHLGEIHTELSDIFERAQTLIIAEDGHPLERTMAHAAAVVHKGHATNQFRLARQHRDRAAKNRAEGRKHALADPFSRVHASSRKTG